jgi:hypothetical protein
MRSREGVIGVRKAGVKSRRRTRRKRVEENADHLLQRTRRKRGRSETEEDYTASEGSQERRSKTTMVKSASHG